MEFKLPESHQIILEIEGEQHEGSYYFLFGKMVVNFKGNTNSCNIPEGEPQTAAVQIFRNLVEEHYVNLSEIPIEWPENIRQAAYAYINSDEDESSLDDLIKSFGESKPGNQAFRQIAHLTLIALQVVVPAWKEICDGNELEKTTTELWKWLEDPDHEIDWEAACKPKAALRHGQQIEDCDACRAEPMADAVAATATFLRTADVDAASEALSSASAAHDEGCHPDDEFDSFQRRLVFSLLPSVLAHGKR